VEGGQQWISGFWAENAQTEVTYLPPPPEPLEAGPSSPAPAPNNVWTQGCWVWQDTAYAWQPGYWVVQQPDWVWAPAHYTWTPRGYVYVPGFWDHDIDHRGVVFAPVYYSQPVYVRHDYYYSPSIAIDLGVMTASLFVQPRSHHYYFGDYYDHSYEERGFYPWYSPRVTRFGYDPMYAHYRAAQLRHDPDWDVHIDERYRFRREHIDARPPRTMALQADLIRTRKSAAHEDFIVGRSLSDAAQRKTMPHRFRSVPMDERKQIQTRGHDVRAFQVERAKIEASPKTSIEAKGGHETARPVKSQLRASPVASKAAGKARGANVPPPMPAASKPQAAEDKSRHATSGKVETKTGSMLSSPAHEKPQRVERGPKTGTSGPAPQTIAPKPDVVKRGRAPAKIETKTQAPQAIEAPKSHRVETKPPQIQTRSRTVEPKREPPKLEAPHLKAGAQNAEPKIQPHRVDPKKQKGQQDPANNQEDNKKRKRS
jgi:hypothetical protein